MEMESPCVVISKSVGGSREGFLLPEMWVSWQLSAEGFT